MGLVRWTGPHQKFQEPPAVVVRHKRKAVKAKSLEDAYLIVEIREKDRCQATGVHLRAGAIDDRIRREHHHIKGRRVRPEWREKPERILLVSALVHGLITAGLLQVEGELATACRIHWRPDVPADHRIVRLLSRRKTEREAEGG